MRARMLFLTVFTVLAIGVSGCGGSSGGEGGYVQPTGAPVASVEIDAGNLFYAPDRVETSAGIVKILLKNTQSGAHNLVISGTPGFILEVGREGDSNAKKVDLKAGSYEIYCTLPGHRSGGMKGTLVAK